MEANNNHPPSPSQKLAPTSTTSISSNWDWDQPLTDLDLQAIDAASSSSRPTAGDCAEGARPNIRRRHLPASLFTHRPQRSKLVDDKLSSECNNTMRVFNSPSMLPCPRNSSFNIYRSPCQVMLCAFLSATSSPRPTAGDCTEEAHPNIRQRRLPASLFTHRRQLSKLPDDKLSSECNNSPSMLPCPRNSSFNIYHFPYQDSLKKVTYPVMSFKGRIVYSRTMSEVEKAADELLKYVEMKKRDAERVIIGFDIEWRPTFTKGMSPGKAAVMQICVDISVCHVMHIIHSGFPQSLQALLRDPTSVKVGVGIGNDARKVFKDHNISVETLEDLSCLANRKLGGDSKVWSLTSLTERLVCRQLPKSSRIRLGNWEAAPLSKAQLDYAATDAYASWYMYEVLSRFPDAVGDVTDEVEKVAHS